MWLAQREATTTNMSTHLIARRKAAHTLNSLCRELEFGSKAENFDAEDHTQWTVQSETLVMAKRGKTVIAIVEMLEGSKRHLTVPRWDGLIRSDHLSAFDPSHYGLVENFSEDVLFHEKFPDSEGEVDFGEPVGLDLPHRPLMKRTRQRPPTVVM
jgi:hypothetical protein